MSDAGTFTGYSFKTWFVKNKETLKNLLTGVLALSTYLSTQNVPKWLQIVLTLIVPTLIRLGIDAIDFYATDVKL